MRNTALVLLVLGLLAPVQVSAQEEPTAKLHLNRSGGRDYLSWPSSFKTAGGQRARPEFVLERSTDLIQWTKVTGALRALKDSAPDFQFGFHGSPGGAFYRLRVDVAPESEPAPEGGAAKFGYGAALREELEQLGFLDLATFAAMYPEPEYLSGITFDPTEARFWTNFATSPGEWNANLPPNSPDRRLHDFRLNPAELDIFRSQGFVVSERLKAPSFGELYYRIYTDDLPVFVTTDSVLHAWHRSFSSMLEEMEVLQLSRLLEDTIGRMRNSLFEVALNYQEWLSLFGLSGGPLEQSFNDADYFLTVALGLIRGEVLSTVMPGNQDRVHQTIAAVDTYKPATLAVFGETPRTIDFSLFRPRGHYTKTSKLERYFRAMMWCGHIDFRVATYSPNEEPDSLRQLGTAIVLHQLYLRAAEYWNKIDRSLELLLGPTDSMTFKDLTFALRLYGISSLNDITNSTVLERFQEDLLSGQFGNQAILAHHQYSPLSPQQVRIPRSFTFLGQKFTFDSWALSQVVFDRVLWPGGSPPDVVHSKVIRRKPSCLDVAFAVLGNDNAAPDIMARILDSNGVKFRDGLPYQHNLAAVRRVIDNQTPATWSANVYNGWLDALRSLSTSATQVEGMPEVMRTKAWAMKDINTQMASWTQLRHDTILYVKQSATPPLICEYPTGLVEPRPEFFKKMQVLPSLMSSAVSHLQLTGTEFVMDPDTGREKMVDVGTVAANQKHFLTRFSDAMVKLTLMAEKALAKQPFSAGEIQFLKDIMEWTSQDYIGVKQYSGWYPNLFYRTVFTGHNFHKDAGCEYPDELVVDVHTDWPDPIVGDPGAVIHQGVGNVNLLMIAVDNGPDRAVYAGPVFSHYEFEMPSGTRLTDLEWSSKLQSSKPPPPPWTRHYLVPAP